MKGQLFLSFLLLASPLPGLAEQLVPAGSIIQCTISEPKVSSATEKVGDPVLCQVSHVELYGRSTFPYGSYLVGRFEEYKDPGHFVGKGWMELKFDRLIVQPDNVIPIQARVVATPKYPVDKEGRIHGTGHPVRDTVEWMIPVLWPIDLINLPRRGPRPVLKPETRLTLKVLDDFGVPTRDELREQQIQEKIDNRRLLSRLDPEPAPAPVQQSYNPPPQQNYNPTPQQNYNPLPQPNYTPAQSYAPPPQPVYQYTQYPVAQPVYITAQPVYVAQPVVVQQPPVIIPQPMVRYMPPPYGYGVRMSYYGPY